MLRKLISLSLAAVMLSVTAFAAADVAVFNAAYAAAEDATGAIAVTESNLYVNGYGLTGSATLSLTSPTDATAIVVTAVHDSETQELVSAAVSEEIALTANTAQEYVASASAPASTIEKYDVKFYLWEKGTLAPVAENTSVTATYGWSGDPSATAPAVATASDLDGTYAGYYMIKSPEDLAWFADYVGSNVLVSDAGTADDTTDDVYSASANAVLCNDIYLNYYEDETGAFDEDWYTVSANVTAANKWDNYLMKMIQTGTFDGAGHTVYGLYTNGPSATDAHQYNGLFREVKGTVKNLNIVGGYLISSKSNATSTYGQNGMLAARISNPGVIENVVVSGIIKCASGKYMPRAGGIAGLSTGATTIKSCTSNVTISTAGGGTTPTSLAVPNSANFAIGGIVGLAQNGVVTVDGCKNNGDVYAPYSYYVGGLIGVSKTYGAIVKNGCVNNGTISGYALEQTGQIAGGFNMVLYIDKDHYKSLANLEALTSICKGAVDATTVATVPTASVATGTAVEAGSTVTLTAARCKIYYAIGDGEYQEYTDAITINEATTIKAYAEFVGSTKTTKGAEATFEYTIAAAE